MSNLMQQIAAEQGINQKVLDGKTYTLHLMTTSQSIGVASELFKLIGPSAANTIDSIRAEEDFLLDSNYMFTTITQLLVERMGQTDLLALIQLLISNVQVNGTAIDFDQHFRGKFDILVTLVKWILEENYKGSFTSLLKTMGLDLDSMKDLGTTILSMNSNNSKDKSSEES